MVFASVARGAALHAGNVGLAIGGAACALALPEHLAQAVHGGVVGVVQRVEALGQQKKLKPSDKSWAGPRP